MDERERDQPEAFALGASNASLYEALRALGLGVLRVDADGHVASMDGVVEALLQQRAPVCLRRPLDDLLRLRDPHRGAPQAGLWERLCASRTAHAVASGTLESEGTERQVTSSIAAVHAFDGRLLGATCVLRDCSAEVAAQLAERRLQLTLANAPLTIFSTDREGRYTCVEGKRLRSLGVTSEELLGKSILELTAFEPRVQALLRRGLSGKAVTFRGASSAGRYECRIVPDFSADGEVCGLTGVSYDVGEQEAAERSLRESEAHLRLALTAGRLVAFELDFRAGSCKTSANAREVLGASAAELSTMDAAFRLVHPDDRPRARATLAREVERGLTVPDVRYRFVRPDNGEIVWIERRIHLVRDADGQVCGARGLLLDVSERMRADENEARRRELETQNRQMQEANRLKDEFLANMSHELRTPLNAVLGFAEILHDEGVDPGSPRYREFLGEILAAGRHLLQLINDVLDLAKVEAGREYFHPEPTSLSELVSQVRAALRSTAEHKHIEVSVELAPDLDAVVIDARRFKQVLFNYLSNALKFTAEGGRVRVRTVPEGAERFRLEVEDTGIGIAPGDLERLFVAFSQLHGGMSKQHPGTGLGLALTRRLVEGQGGTVGVSSQLGVGSTFTASLPRMALMGLQDAH